MQASRHIFVSFIPLAASLFFFASFLYTLQARAEGNPDAAPATVVATTGIADEKIVSQEGHTLTLSFNLTNKIGAQPQVRYMVELKGKDLDGLTSVRDQYVYPETVSLAENTVKPIQVTYTAPAYLSGVYDLWIKAANENGLLLSLARVGTVSFEGGASSFQLTDCALSLPGSGETYTLTQGVDIAPTERLTVSCSVVSTFAEPVAVSPHYLVKHRSVFGAKVSEETVAVERVTVDTKTKKLSFTVPAITKPQSYEVLLSLVNDAGAAVSNTVPIHIVIQGESATIQNVVLDKARYTVGDVAQLSFFWTPSADSFTDSRIGTGTAVAAPSVRVTLRGGDGTECADTLTGALSSSAPTQTLAIPITHECVDPVAQVALINAAGVALDSQTLAVDSPATPAPVSSEPPLEALFLVTLLVLMVAVPIGFVVWKKKAASIAPLILVLGFACGALSYGGGVAHAAGDTKTFTVQGSNLGGYYFIKSTRCPTDFDGSGATFHFDWPYADGERLGMYVLHQFFCVTLTDAERDLFRTDNVATCTTGACGTLHNRLLTSTPWNNSSYWSPSSGTGLDLLGSGTSGNVWARGNGAGTYSGSHFYGTAQNPTPSSFTVALDKSVYTPGEARHLSSNVTTSACANGDTGFSQLSTSSAYPDGTTQWQQAVRTSSTGDYDTVLSAAPTVPGSYTTRVYGFAYQGHFGTGEVGWVDLAYTVACPSGQTWDDATHSCIASAPPTASMTFSGLKVDGTPTNGPDADPMKTRTWTWSSTNGTAGAFEFMNTNCRNAEQNNAVPVTTWTPWNGNGGTGDALGGSQTGVPGPDRYGCQIHYKYTVTSASGEEAFASGDASFICGPGYVRNATGACEVASGPTAELYFNDSTDISDVDPLEERVWRWNSTGADIFSAKIVISECKDTSVNNPLLNPWDLFGSQPRSGGEARGIPGASRYGCRFLATYTATNTATDRVAVATARVKFKMPECTGGSIADASLCEGDDLNLSQDTPKALVTACTAAKCEYTCNTGFTRNGNVCVRSTGPWGELSGGPTCTIPFGASSCSLDVNWRVANLTGRGTILREQSGSSAGFLKNDDITGDGSAPVSGITPTPVTFTLFDSYGGGAAELELDTLTVRGVCQSGTYQDGICSNAVDARCGFANGASYPVRPTALLCNPGTAEWLNDEADGTYDWVCKGVNGGDDSSPCQASISYSCAGTPPSPAEHTAVASTNETPTGPGGVWKLVSSNTTARCEKVCTDGYSYDPSSRACGIGSPQ